MAGKTILGSRVRDVITGFEGTVTGRAEYISGCHQALIAPALSADGAMRDSQWIDEQRLERVGSAMLTLDNGATPGCDRQAPKR